MNFQDASPGPNPSFVNLTMGERGLQFPDSGLEVDLPIPVPWVRMRVGRFATPYTIECLDQSGIVVAAHTMNIANAYQNLRLRGPDISLVRFMGGNNEGVVVSLCISV